MKLEVRIHNLDLTDSLRAYADRRLRFALDHFAPHIQSVTVRLTDVNAGRGGVDKCCRLTAHIRVGGKVVVEETDVDLYKAIDRATEKMESAFGKRLHRLRRIRDRRSVRTA